MIHGIDKKTGVVTTFTSYLTCHGPHASKELKQFYIEGCKKLHDVFGLDEEYANLLN
jgi:hypothetical protein